MILVHTECVIMYCIGLIFFHRYWLQQQGSWTLQPQGQSRLCTTNPCTFCKPQPSCCAPLWWYWAREEHSWGVFWHTRSYILLWHTQCQCDPFSQYKPGDSPPPPTVGQASEVGSTTLGMGACFHNMHSIGWLLFCVCTKDTFCECSFISLWVLCKERGHDIDCGTSIRSGQYYTGYGSMLS